MSPNAHPIAVTGASGFIGSALTRHLVSNSRGPVCAVDDLGTNDRFQNLSGLALADFFDSSDFLRRIELDRGLPPLRAILHLGACSDTTETNGDFLMRNNFAYTRTLAQWCLAHGVRFIYASSAATYGDGELGYDDDIALLPRLRPRNKYAYSKHAFDLWALEHGAFAGPGAITGLKYFNVFGPNEYHKGEMMSLVAKRFDDAKAGSAIRLFKSHRAGIADGEQRRDFIYVDDAVAVVRWLLETPSVSGIFNVGTGKARSFRDLMTAMFAALGRKPAIEYIDMPASIRDSYQYFTQAETTNLRRAGYNADFTPLEEAVQRYVTGYLDRPDRYR